MTTKPVLHFLCGKMAAGKTTLSKRLAQETGAILICEDLWLSKLYPDEIHSLEDYLRLAARVKVVVAAHALQLLEHGLSVVLDFPGNVPSQRAWFRTLFEAAGADHVLHVIDASDALCKAQLLKRNQALPEGSKTMSEAEFDHITSYFRPPTPEEGFRVKVHVAGPTS